MCRSPLLQTQRANHMPNVEMARHDLRPSFLGRVEKGDEFFLALPLQSVLRLVQCRKDAGPPRHPKPCVGMAEDTWSCLARLGAPRRQRPLSFMPQKRMACSHFVWSHFVKIVQTSEENDLRPSGQV